jgi:uncharacterized protein
MIDLRDSSLTLRLGRRPWFWLYVLALLATAAALPCAAKDPVWPPITEPATSQYVPGKWVWAELFTEDAAAATAFYGKVFGWTFRSFRAGHGPTYTLASSGDEPIGGMIEREHKFDKQRGSRWVGMISVNDVKAAARYAEQHGGKVIVAPRMLQGRGDVALLADPEGAPFGVIHSSSGDPPDFLGDDRQWVWIELWAKDPQAMAQFYSGLAGYESEPLARPDGRAAFLLAAGGYTRCAIIETPDRALPSAWLPYIRVSDVKATAADAAQAGARVVLAPNPQIRDGRVALIADPTGAPLGLAQLAAEESNETR